MKRAKKLTLFQRGAAAGQRYSGSYEHYLCPICKSTFNQLALSAGELTIEHVPPAAVGGKPIALTCRACNTTCGHSIDAAVNHRDHVLRLTKTIARIAFGQGGRAVLRIGGQPLNVDVTDNADGIVSLNILERSNDSRRLERVKTYLETLTRDGSWEGAEFHFSSAAHYHDRLAKVGDLRAAFLVAFAACCQDNWSQRENLLGAFGA